MLLRRVHRSTHHDANRIPIRRGRDWEENVKKSLERTISEYEHRLKDIKVHVELAEVEEEVRSKFPNARRRVRIGVKGILISNDKPFHFSTYLYISPLSQ